MKEILRRLVMSVVDMVRRGLIVIGASTVGLDHQLTRAADNELSRSDRTDFQLPHGHPERLATHIPLSDEERRLWSQLMK